MNASTLDTDTTQAHPQTPEDPETRDAPSEPAKSRRSWLRVMLWIILLLFALLLLGSSWVLGTQSGLRFSLSTIEKLAPGLLAVELADGRILGDLHLAGVRVQAPGLELKLGSLDLRWTPAAVLTGTLRIVELSVRGLDVATAPSAEEDKDPSPAPIALPQIVLPLQVELEQALVEDFGIGTLGEDARFRVDRVALAASLQGSALTLEELAVALPEPLINAVAQGRVELTGDYPIDLDLAWDLAQEPALQLKGIAKLGGDLRRLQVEHDLTGSAEAELRAQVLGVLESPRWDGKLRIRRVDLPAVLADLPAVALSGELTTSGDLDDARVQGMLTGEAPDLPDFGRLAAALDVTWRNRVLHIAALELTEDKSGAHLTADGRLDLTDPAGAFDLNAAWEKLRWPLTGESVVEARQGKIDAQGTFEAFAYQVAAEVWGRDFPPAKLQLRGAGDLEGTQIERLRIDTLEGKIDAEGRVAWAPELSWDLKMIAGGIDPRAQWPGIATKIGLDLVSKGKLDAFDYALKAFMVGGETLPAAMLKMNGSGDIGAARIAALRLETLGGHLDAEADVAWDPVVTWDAKLDAANINPGKQWPEWEGRLGGRVQSAGALEDAGPNLRAQIESLKGELRGYPVSATAQVQMKGDEIRIEELRAASGPSDLRLAGSVGERLALEFGLGSPDLANLLPDARGGVKASGTVSGPLDAPAVKLGLSAEGVAVAGQRIASLSGSANLDLAPGGPMKVDLTGKGLETGGMAFDNLRVQGDGDMGSHRLSVRLAGEPLTLDLKAAGGLNADNAYAGRLTDLAMISKDFGSWQLQKAAAIVFAGARISAGPLCVREVSGSRGCVGFDQTAAGSWRATLDLEPLAFDLFKDLVPEDLSLEGEVRAKADFRAVGGALTGNARVQVPKGALSVPGEHERMELVDFASTALTVDAGANGLQAKLRAPLSGLGDLSGDIALPGWSLQDSARPGQALRGGVRARVADLGVLARFVPDISNLTGSFDADFKLSGTIAKPSIAGSAKLARAGLEVPFIGLKIEDMAFNADGGTDRIDYRGGLTAGAGRLEIGGQTLLAAGGPVTRITAKGDKLTLADSKEYFALVTPDLAVSIEPMGTQIRGTLTVPEARIRPRSIPADSISPSPDVVVVTDASQEEKPRYATRIDMRLVLGKAVKVKAFGLEGGIRGELALIQNPGKELLGDGELKIVEGTYRISTGSGLTAAIGKPLIIEQGFLSYAKSPINNPFLVLTAQREGGDTTAGLRVFGTIKNPKMTFFSSTDPGMSQSEITTYLLTGIPPKRDGAQEADKGLSVGTYIAPKLFAEYESSLGDEADKIKLRYDLNDWIELQTETGDSQGGDIFFKIER